MNINRVCAVYFSPTGNTRLVVCAAAHRLAERLGAACTEISITVPGERLQELCFGADDLTVIGAPTYAGKLPNKMLPYYQEHLRGRGTAALAMITYGNRSYDNSLAELCHVLGQNGFCTVAAGAFAGTHAFSDLLAPGRPDKNDMQEVLSLADAAADKLLSDATLSPVQPDGDADAPYYVPKGTDGQPAKFLKAKPLTDAALCVGCGLCARECPMGSIDSADSTQVTGICIKCQSCVRKCPRKAKYFEDAAFLSHVAMLEQNFTRRADNCVFV